MMKLKSLLNAMLIFPSGRVDVNAEVIVRRTSVPAPWRIVNAILMSVDVSKNSKLRLLTQKGLLKVIIVMVVMDIAAMSLYKGVCANISFWHPQMWPGMSFNLYFTKGLLFLLLYHSVNATFLEMDSA